MDWSIENVKNISVMKTYQNYTMAVFAGGEGKYGMFWGGAIYEKDKTIHTEHLPRTVLDVDEGMNYLEKIIDWWEQPIIYEDIVDLRNICEYLWNRNGKNSYWYPVTTHTLIAKVNCYPQWVLPSGLCKRQILWDNYKIHLIKYTHYKKISGWCLKGNWEDKIHFLEQVYILGKDPNKLPKPWLIKWQKQELANNYNCLVYKLKDIDNSLHWLGQNTEKLNTKFIYNVLKRLKFDIQETKKVLSHYRKALSNNADDSP